MKEPCLEWTIFRLCFAGLLTRFGEHRLPVFFRFGRSNSGIERVDALKM